MDPILQSLWVTLLGMGLTFAAIVLFWGLMWGITALPFKDEEEGAEEAETEAEPAPAGAGGHSEEKAKAAALAVAVALAEEQQRHIAYFPMPETAFVSAWQLGMRTRQMYQKGEQSRR
jgi:sodium pump decarboxylase gamma subunit